VGQRDAPRTHSTIFAVPFEGTTAGSELRRDYDQRRDLAYARLEFDGRQGPIRRAHLGVSWQRHWEERDRLRTGGRSDLEGFDLDQYGVQLQVETPTRIGRLTWGADWYRDRVDTWRTDYLNGVLTSTSVQGPLGDEGTYDLLGVYVQDEVQFGCLDLIGGARFTYAEAAAGRVDNPAVAGSDPATPGNVIAVENDWTDVVGSLQALYHLTPTWNVYASAAQAFRTPTLHDLTSLEVTSVVETPAPGLDAEEYLTFEIGTKTASRRLSGSAAVYYTLLDDAIIRSPTGMLVGGVPEVRKDNIGDGWLWGFELEAAWQAFPAVTLFGNVSYNRGRADELDPATGMEVRSPISRLLPLTGTFGARYEPPSSRFWLQGELTFAGRQDRLSLRDRTDGQRIPPGGTPAWQVVNLRAGVDLGNGAHLSVALENLLDENYRIHGSGLNEPGLNFVAALDVEM
jgi:hemoglobin/transferrin/lactoferrin receptor protein